MKGLLKTIGSIASIPVVLATSLLPANAWEPWDYEIWIVAKRMNEGIGTIARPTGCKFTAQSVKCEDVGHAWVAVVYKDAMNYWAVDSTTGFWDDGKIKWNEEKNDTLKIIKNEPISRRNHEVRKIRVTKSRADWFKRNAVNNTGCREYHFLPTKDGQCNCVTFAVKAWDDATSRWEYLTYHPEPDNLANTIKNKNQQNGDMVDGGKRWQ